MNDLCIGKRRCDDAASSYHYLNQAWLDWSLGLPPVQWFFSSLDEGLSKIEPHLQYSMSCGISLCSVSCCSFVKEPPHSRSLWFLWTCPCSNFFLLALWWRSWQAAVVASCCCNYSLNASSTALLLLNALSTVTLGYIQCIFNHQVYCVRKTWVEGPLQNFHGFWCFAALSVTQHTTLSSFWTILPLLVAPLPVFLHCVSQQTQNSQEGRMSS